ncbi:galactose-binding lectin-like [Arachis ipaensis]|nr:galactose-binding lectin-like [Arachis ipaensis]
MKETPMAIITTIPKPINLIVSIEFPTMKPFWVVLTFFLLLVASKKANSIEIVEFVSFNFDPFSHGNPAIELQGDATILTDGNVLLTDFTSPGSTGRVLYAPPVRLWDTASGNVANFITSFSFQLTDYQAFTPADGIVFFIAPENTQIPPGATGGALGVADPSGVGEFVGVEFDTFSNDRYRDPPHSHVGIDVNSVVSLKTVEWNRQSGSVVEVTVIYDSSSKTLSVAVKNRSGEIVTISEVVDLKEKLPERVKFGFSSAGSLDGRQINLIRSWSFSSSLKTVIDVASG